MQVCVRTHARVRWFQLTDFHARGMGSSHDVEVETHRPHQYYRDIAPAPNQSLYHAISRTGTYTARTLSPWNFMGGNPARSRPRNPYQSSTQVNGDLD